MKDLHSRLENLVFNVVRSIAVCDEDYLDGIYASSRVKRGDLERVVSEYGRKLTVPPAGAYVDIDPIKIDGQFKNEWAVDIPLWTREEGRSDLAMQLTIILDADQPVIMIDDCRVM